MQQRSGGFESVLDQRCKIWSVLSLMLDPRRRRQPIREHSIDRVHYTHLTVYSWVKYEIWVCTRVSACMARVCYWGTAHPFPLYGGPLRSQSIVDVPCPLSGDIHHSGFHTTPPRLCFSKPQGRALMRSRSPHPSGPCADTPSAARGQDRPHLNPRYSKQNL